MPSLRGWCRDYSGGLDRGSAFDSDDEDTQILFAQL